MSHGPGRWQRVLLDALVRGDLLVVDVVVYNYLEREPTRSEMVAARRAAARLAEDGKARAIYLGRCRSCGELTAKRWSCRVCGRGCGAVLALTSTAGFWSGCPSLVSLAKAPEWLSVAPVVKEQEATLSAVDGGHRG